MHATIECYGAPRSATGQKTVDVELDDEATVADALAALAEKHPPFERCLRTELVVMRDATHVEETDAVADGDALSISNPPMVED